MPAVIDTGFTGYLTLPERLIEQLGLSRQGAGEAVIADGSVHRFDIYRAEIVWDQELRSIEVEAVDALPLVGMKLIEGYELRIEAVINGRIALERFSGHSE
ncbi:MAG TPA: hypothetical protein VHV77_04220 [Pirellulales bacterium]|nr:hypothetical protein [Pirellulales bacterium]